MSKPLTVKQQFWFDHISAAQASAQPLSDYAAEHNLSVKALYNWRWTFSKTNLALTKKQNPFVKIAAIKNVAVQHIVIAPVIVTLPNGVSVQLPALTPELLVMLRA